MRATPIFVFTILGAVVIAAAAFGIDAAMQTGPTLMSARDYALGQRTIETEVRAALSRCREAPQAQRELCKARARADERVRKAELEATYYGTVEAQARVSVARAKARFEVARASCSGRHGSARLACLREARSTASAPRDPKPDAT